MLNKWGCIIVVIAGAIYTGLAVAQTDGEDLKGLWRQDLQSLIIEVKEQESSDGLLEAIVIKEDWNPGLVGTIMFKDLSYDEKSKKWSGLGFTAIDAEMQPVDIKIKRRGTQLLTRMKVGPHKKVKWKRMESD